MAEKEYIERDTIYRRVKERTNPYGKPTIDYESGVKVLNLIKQEPAADVVEVRHGHWIDKPTGRYMHMGSWCSVCGEKSGIGGIESNRHKPYCPNCGAKMDGERKEQK